MSEKYYTFFGINSVLINIFNRLTDLIMLQSLIATINHFVLLHQEIPVFCGKIQSLRRKGYGTKQKRVY